MITYKTSIKKYGSGLCLPLPKKVANEMGWTAGTSIQIEVNDAGLHVTRDKRSKLFPFTEEELIANCAPAGFHDHLLASDYEWP
jgi:antitoxin component of MazEF toxin-antitoxin module